MNSTTVGVSSSRRDAETSSLFAETRAGVETQECPVSSNGQFNDCRDQSVVVFHYFTAKWI